MSQHRETVRVVTLGAAGGGSDTARIWDTPVIEPIRNMTIYISSDGVATGAGDLQWEVFYGGAFNGDPFNTTTTTHVGGVSQSSGIIVGGTEIAEQIFNDPSMLPANARRDLVINHQPAHWYKGLPVVLYLENDKAVPVTLFVTFLSESVSERL